MYLRRLEAQGFKSFANKTALEFSDGVTCIIGPNGTGKTNVADAIRWVLGEHASRTIRARKTEDVIFAGSDKRPALGVAEVSITLDNSSGWLPIDYHEVVVSRRAYRDGENEYYINHGRVRLRDVIDLFQRAQVGQNSYAFMGQGMVEQVLSLRPEDRRALIEEAADVRQYRTRLEDAQNKLKATRENMDRVRLLIREIEPRINQLERQAGRAVKYQELTKELAATLHVWFSHQWHDVNERLLASITTQDQRTEDFERARADAKAREDGLVQLRAAIDERRREIDAREARLRAMRDYVSDLERRVALDSEREKMLRERVDELAEEIAQLRTEAHAHAAATAEVDTSEIEAKLGEARIALDATRAELAAVEQRILEHQRSALLNEQEAARERAAEADLARRIEEQIESLARLEAEAVAAGQERAQAETEHAAREQEHAQLAEKAERITQELARAAEERTRASELLAARRHELTAAEDALRSLRSELDAAQVRLQMVEQLDVQPIAPDAGVQAILEAGRVIKSREVAPPEVELEGVVGLVGQLLRVPPGLEKAIEAALAENLFAVVFEHQADMRAALEMLLTHELGRATMYTLDNFQESRPINLIKERGVVGVASSLVKCDSRYRRLIDTLLGRTVVVEDIELARRFVRRGLASAVATLSGVLLRPVGSVAAGTIASVEASFAHDRDVHDLPDEIARLRPLVAEREATLDEMRAAIGAGHSRVEELDRRIESLRAERANVDSALADAKTALATVAARLQSREEIARQRRAEIERLQAGRGRIEVERDNHSRAAAAAVEREQEDRAAIARLETERERLSSIVAEQAAGVAAIEAQLRNERQATEGDRIALERLERQIAAKDEQKAKAQREAEEIASRLARDRRELEEKSAEARGLADDLAPAREELAQLESRERTLSAELVEANAHVREAERLLFEAQNDVRARRDELDALKISLQEEGFIATADGEIERAPAPVVEPEYEDASEYVDHNGDVPSWMRSADGDEIPPVRGGSTINPTEVRDRIADLRAQIRALGPINEQAASDYEESRDRYDFLKGQVDDLNEAESQLLAAIDELDQVIRERFRATFKTVNREFERYFNAFFRGGTARLELGETDEQGLPGIEIVAQPPGKKLGSLALLSGGERSLTAVALLFALLQANPSPICVLDEVDAALDEANVGRFVEELRKLAEKTQFIIITHNRRTIEIADAIYGVSMGADSVSRVLSLKLADLPRED